jgi:hypothetical protein
MAWYELGNFGKSLRLLARKGEEKEESMTRTMVHFTFWFPNTGN